MAEIITEWPSIVRTRKSIYPWEEWTDGNIRQASEGVDFVSSLKTFVQGLYAYAARHNVKVEVRTAPSDGVVAFRFVSDAETNGASADSNGQEPDEQAQAV